jgi:hypothetical protein
MFSTFFIENEAFWTVVVVVVMVLMWAGLA